MKYVPLYIKTDNSLQESLIKINDLIKFATDNHIDALTITDNNMYGVMDFYKACLANHIKPIIGLELSVDSNKIVLYALNYDGYKNLIKLNTIQSEGTLDIKILEKYSSDLVCIVPYEYISIYSDIRDLYKYIFKGYKNIDEKNNLEGELIYINETLYLYKKDNVYIKYLDAIKEGTSYNNVSTNKLDNYINLEKDVQDLLTENNTFVYENCNVTIPFGQDLMPIYENPEHTDSYTYLKKKCIEGMKLRFGDKIGSKYQERLKYELDVINKMGFSDYFLIVYDYIKYAKENNIIVGPGRGSAVGSLVAYVLNIIDIDPLKYDLLFERFLNIERVSMPDIDVDFEHNKRETMIEYCINRYGVKNVAPIITFGTLASKQAIRDIGKAMNIDLPIIDGLCKIVDSRLSLKENYDNPKVQNYIARYDDLDKLYDIAYHFEGLKRHTSIHAAGIIMSKYPLDEVIPLDKGHNKYYTTGYDMRYLEEIGLLKMDFLAIKYLTIIHEIIDDINIVYHTNLTFDNIPFNDKEALKIFENANTLGIFQFESDGMINFLKRLKINSFDDICAAIALYRPGPMNNIPVYIRRKHTNEKINYYDDSLKPILESTYGIMIYQEQIMQIAQVMAGYTLGEADILRKAMSKKKKDLLLKEEEKFTKQSIERGYDSNVVKQVYSLMLKFAEYGFNKSHSVGYSLVAYRMAYLKAHYPKIFISNLLSTEMNDETKSKKYMYEAKNLGTNILYPSINTSSDKYIEEEQGIRYPLSNIKNIGINAVNTIIEERNNNGLFKDIFDFIKRVYGKAVNRKVLESLIYAGVFNEFNLNRQTLINNLDEIINYGELIKDLDEEFALKPEIIEYDEYEDKIIMEHELELFGMYLTNHPVTNLKNKYSNIINLIDIPVYFDKQVNVIAYVDSIKEITTKKNEKMAFIIGSDEGATVDITIFPKLFETVNNIKKGDIIMVKGKVEKRFDKYQVISEKIVNIKK